MVFDLTVPGGMGGKEAVVEVRKIAPKTPVFVASGYADDPVMAHPGDFGFTASLRKPFRRSEFARMLESHLGSGPGDAE
jgi:CheY-like chemotaxis protein